MRTIRSVAAVAAGLFVVGCQGQKPPMPAMPPPAVSVLKPVPYPVKTYFQYNGNITPVEVVDVRANVQGYLEKVHFAEGAEVKKGDVLYTIDPREYEATVAKAEAEIQRARADNANAKAQIKRTEADLERLKKLERAASQTETDKAEADVASAKAQLNTAVANEQAGEAAKRTAQIQLDYTKIHARIGGKINRTRVTEGNLVGLNETMALTTIVALDELYVEFDAPERDLAPYLSLADPAAAVAKKYPVEVGVANDLGFPHVGVIYNINNRVDVNTGTVRITGKLKNPKTGPKGERALYPGLYARVRVPMGEDRKLPVIPEDALMTGQEGRYVYVVGPENVIQKRTVTVAQQVVWRAPPPGSPDQPWMENPTGPPPKLPDGSPGKPYAPKNAQSIVAIESGLTADDVIVVNGLQKVMPGKPVTPETWELLAPSKK